MIQQKIATDSSSTHSYLRTCSLAALMAASVMFSSCASTPKPPKEALQAADLAIATAEQARVAEYASPELGEAREKLTAARIAVEKKDMVKAERLAQESRVDAELALAKANAKKAKSVNDEMQKSISTLKEEMQRNTGAQ